MNDASPRQQIVDSIKNHSNILVTVSTSPSVDELSAALGLTILLNNINKRATAVVSGQLPPAITFLDPEKTFESTVDSLRDFIIALDKEKADHLRYKVEGDVVKIFITPYRTTLTEKDLQFSQGDYNVELVIALGVKDKEHLDKALEAHGRILHDATVATICAGVDISTLGSISWQDEAASSLCEMLVSLAEPLKADNDKPVLDEQIATALLTGIVSATDRFSNNKTSSRVMTMAAQLMAAGANQQLIAAKLEEAHEIGPNSAAAKAEKRSNADGTTSLSEGEATAVDKEGRKAKKPKDGFAIKHEDKPTEEAEQPPVEEKKAEEAALAAAAPAIEVAEEAQQKLADELEAVAQPAAPSVESLQEQLAEELGTAAAEQPATDASLEAPGVAEENTPQPPAEEPGTALGLDFETLPPPAEEAKQAIPAPQETTEPAQANIDASHTNGYIDGSSQSPFQAPINGLEQGDGEPATVDPFATPLQSSSIPTIQPDPLFEAQQLTSKAAPSLDVPPPVNVTADMPDYEEAPIPNDPAAVASVPDFEALNPTGLSTAPLPAMPVEPPASPASDLPPLPPLPDFSTLPPLPPPPQFGTAPPADTSTPPALPPSDALGDIFSAEQLPSAPAAAPEPTPPNQFKIPGQ